MARVDIWMPVWNAQRTLPAALRSLERQTFRDWRLIVVDDGSRDGTAGILRMAAARDRRISPLFIPHGGIVAALQAAARASDAPLVARMDGDDVCHRDRLAAQLEVDADVVATRVRIEGGEGMRLYLEWQNALVTHEAIVNNLYVESPIAHPTVLFRREAYDGAGGYRAVAWPEDYDLWMRMAQGGSRFAKVARPLLRWRDLAGRLTRTHPMYSKPAFHAAKLRYLVEEPILKRGPVTIWGAGPIGKGWARDLKARGFEVEQAIDIDPKKIGRKIAGSVPVRGMEEGLRLRRGPVLGAVGSRGARELIRERLEREGLVEARDFLFVA